MFWQQLKALLRKQAILKWVGCKKTTAEILLPIVFGFLTGWFGAFFIGHSDSQNAARAIFTLVGPFLLASTLTAACFATANAFVLNTMVYEKETKMRESLRIMSMQRFPYAMSFMAGQFLYILLISGVFTGTILIFWGQARDFDFEALQFFVAVTLYGLGTMTLTMSMSTLFQDSKLASQLGNFLLFLPVSIFFFGCCEHAMRMLQNDLKPVPFYLYLGYFLPQFPFGVILLNIMMNETAFNTLNVNLTSAWIFLVLSVPAYFALYVYLDIVMPSTYGIRAPCCFCLKKNKVDKENKTEIEMTEVGTAAVKIRALKKSFGELNALENFTLDIEAGQICCLLGHNGAGKTTLVNMLTGMLQPTGGDAFIFGHSLTREIQACQRDIGLCQQFDVLYNQLSAEQHLRLVCDLKGLQGEAANKEIKDTLELVMLTEHKKKKSQDLSGGMKRKLSLAMSLVGSSKLIILDEPTSGLDTDSRQTIWEVLKRVKQEKSIILSTQHIEEADVLADNICVLSHGKIIAKGSPDRLKTQYGVGYNLIIESKSHEPGSLPIGTIERALEIIPSRIVKDKDEDKGKMIVQIPYEEDSKMADLIKQLEQLGNNIIVAVETVSLEDAYLNIVEQSSKYSNFSAEQDPLLDQKNDKFKERVLHYASTNGNPSKFTQIQAMIIRRLITFFREPRQMFLVLLPFLNIAIICLIVGGIFMIISSQSDSKETDDILQQAFNYAVSSIFPFMLNYGFCTSAGSYTLMPVSERENETRSILHSSGLTSLAYWTGLLVADMAVFIGLTALFGVFILVVQLFAFYEFFGWFMLETVIFGLSLLTFTYLLSNIFDRQNTAISWIMPILVILGSVVPILAFIVLSMAGDSEHDVLFVLYALYYGSPITTYYFVTYNILVHGIFNKINEEQIKNGYPTKDNVYGEYEGQVPSTARNIITMICQAILYFTLVVLIDQCNANKHRKQDGKKIKSEIDVAEGVPTDVMEHTQKIKQVEETTDQAYQIKAVDLRKVYGSGKKALQAVCDQTLGVKAGEITGLLGPNGAGKTSIFKMLAMQQTRSSGKIRLMQQSTEKINLSDEGKRIGLCPQYNSGYDQLTVQENLQFIARLKGISEQDLAHNVDLIVETLNLEEFKNVRCMNLSGGNKRKLSVAMTMLLVPKIEFLDEPTTGVDPVSRRALFKMIKLLENSAILMTTHRMDEAEQLCDNIAIMVNGRFACYGSPNYLLHQYGQGYQFDMILGPNQTQTQAENSLMQNGITFQCENVLVEGDLGYKRFIYKYVVPEGTQPILSQLFSALSQAKEKGLIFSFKVTRGTLEQVFIRFAQMQRQALQANGMPTTGNVVPMVMAPNPQLPVVVSPDAQGMVPVMGATTNSINDGSRVDNATPKIEMSEQKLINP